MIEIEDVLINGLSEESDVDGHDFGSGEMNIFIYTDNPTKTFAEIKSLIGSQDHWTDARVAYREIEKDDYTILWPKDLLEFKLL